MASGSPAHPQREHLVKTRSALVHERLAGEETVHGSSDRAFGFVAASALGLVGLAPLVHGRPVRWPCLAAAIVVAALAQGYPRALAPANRLWLRLGLLLHAAVNPVVMGILFYTTLTPMGLAMRLLGKDPLRLRLDREAGSYWIPRRPPGPSPDTMRRQF
jgi:saxitoxin biosynthesis operon SxtJ-like protein